VKDGGIVHLVSRGAFWLALEKAAALLSGLVYFALLLRWLGPTQYGMMTLATAITGFATMATGNFEMFLERYAAEYDARGLLRTLRRAHLLALSLKLALGLAAGTAVMALAPQFARQYAMPELILLVTILALTVVFDGLSTTGRATLYGMQQFRWLSALAILFHIAKTVLVGLLWWTGRGLVDLALGLTILTVVQGLAQAAVPLWMLRQAEDREPPAPEREWRRLLRNMFGYCIPLLGARITFMSGQNLSTLILGRLFDPAILGYFKFAFQTVERFVELVHTAPSSLLPSFTRLVAQGERERLCSVFEQALRLIQTLAAVFAFGLFLFARELTVFVASPVFKPAIPTLRVLALVPVARTAQQPFTLLFQSLRRPATVLGVSLIKFVTEFGSYFLLVTSFGMIGAAWANLAGAIAAYIASLVLAARLMPEGAAERTRTALLAAGMLPPLIAVTLLLDWLFHGPVLLLCHLALVPVVGVAVFALGLVRRRDLDKLADVPLQTPWARVIRGISLAVLGIFARLGEPRRAS
jgi:PST family polysaccharide transporter